jgi:cytochrome c oxidase subunit III
MPESAVAVSEPYRTAEQQHQAAMMGMYIFLCSEVMLFGGIFTVAAVMHLTHDADIVEASKAMHYWVGGINTAVLLTSSLFVALAVEASKLQKRSAGLLLAAAALLGLCFLGLKAYEYNAEFSEGLLPVPGVHPHFKSFAQHMLMNLYLIATALHAFHLTIGIILLTGLAVRLRMTSQPQLRPIVIIVAGLYWHLVDVIWVFLYPVFYLAR